MAYNISNAAAKVVNLAGGTVAAAIDIEGGYFPVASLNDIPDHAKVLGSLCYCTTDGKFYQYNGTNWIEKEFGTAAEATTSEAGLMSASDKTKLTGIESGAEVNVQSDWNETNTSSDAYIKNKPVLKTVATSGSYNDLTNKPTIPTKSSWNYDDTYVKYSTAQSLTEAQKTQARTNIGAGTSNFSGSYDDLANKPAIPTVNNATLTIQQNGTNVATFTANSSSDVTANITIPTGAAADKGVDTGISAGSTSTNLPTSQAVAAFVEGKGYKTTDTTYTAATSDKDGLMSKTDKANLDTIVTSFNSDDSNTTINTIKEVLTAFENAPEGTNIANALAEKANVGHTHTVTTTSAAPDKHTHNIIVSGTTGANSGTAVNAVTGYNNFSGGSGSLSSNTTATDGIKYVESVSHTAASLTGTKTFNTDAIKDVMLSASTTSTDGPAYVESVTHTAATLSGTTTFNTDAIKSVSLSASTKSTDGPAYVESFSGSAPSLKGETTFVTAQGTLSGGSGSLEAYDAETNGAKKVSNGTRIPFVTSISNTPASASETTTVLTGVKTETDTFVKTISGGSGSLKSYDADSNGTATTSSGRVPYLHDVSHTPASLTGDTTFIKTQGTFNAGTTPVSEATPTHTNTATTTNSGTAVTALTGVRASSTATAVNASYSKGVLTLTPINNVVTGVAADGTADVAPSGHTHNYDKTTEITLKRGTAPSLGDAITGTVEISGGSISKTTYYLDHAHTAASAESTGNAVTSVTSDGTADAVTGVTGGTTTATTHYLAHGHTAASLSDATTGKVEIDGGAYTATTKHMKATGTAAGTGTVTISGGSITPVTKYMKKTTTAASTGTVGISSTDASVITKYLHHAHAGASLGTPSTSSVAPSSHTHSYGSSTALTTDNNSGTAVEAITAVDASTN